jgi:hypothetical protein
MSDFNEFDFSGSTGAEIAKEASSAGDFEREVMFLSIKGDQASVQNGDNRVILRFVTDAKRQPWMGDRMSPFTLPWITVKQHSFLATRPRPPFLAEKARWPEKMGGGCRKDKVFAAKFNNQCILCDRGDKPSARTWALAIEREQVFENGQMVGIRDKTREVFDHDAEGNPIVLSEDNEGKKTYKMKTVPAWIVVNQGWKNFFGPLDGTSSYFGGVLGRDWLIQRQGTKADDTSYSFIGLDPQRIEGDFAEALGVAPGTNYDMGLVVQQQDGHAVPLMEVLYPDMPDLRRLVADRVSDNYIGRYFDPNWFPPDFDPSKAPQQGQQGQQGVQNGYQPTGGIQNAGQPQQPQTPTAPAPQGAAPGDGSTADNLAALRARIGGGQAASQ